ncbi:MAG: HEPN domain-containing protein [Deltaproteobacteria bacterium]|nr:HEPN domain-containing protein [Deltaproteobacteria bacterium]
MKDEETRNAAIEYWLEKAGESLNSARSEQKAGRFVFAINRAYYGCFYSASAVLLKRGEKFSKHSGVRAAIHRSLVKTGEINTRWGKFYDLIFNSRQRGDYQELVVFSNAYDRYNRLSRGCRSISPVAHHLAGCNDNNHGNSI